MRNIIIYRLLILALAAGSFCSCQKEEAEDIATGDYDYQSHLFGAECTHPNMEYNPASEPDESSFGWIEHYSCPDCGGCFSDSEGRYRIEEVIDWGTSYNLDASQYVSAFCDAYETIIDAGTVEEGTAITAAAILELLKKAALNELKEVYNKIVDVFHKKFGGPPAKTVNDYLAAIIDQLGNIENAISAVSSTLEKLQEKNLMIEREQGIFYLSNATHYCFKEVLNQFEGFDDGSKLTQDRKDKIKRIVNDWYATGIYNGVTYEDCYTRISDLMHFFNGYIASKPFPQMYDEIINKATPWKHEQEYMKYMMRISDVMTLTEAYFMLVLYLNFNPDGTSAEKLKLLNNELLGYHKVIETYPVPHAEEKYFEWIWADKEGKCHMDAIYLDREVKHYTDTVPCDMDNWFSAVVEKKRKWCEREYPESIWKAGHSNDHPEIDQTDGRVIWNYYYRATRVTDFYEMLRMIGFTKVTDFKNKGRIFFRDDAGWKWDYSFGKEKFWGRIGALRFEGNGPGTIFFSNCIGNDGFNIYYGGNNVIFRTNCNWCCSWKGKPEHINSYDHKSIGNIFEAVTYDATKKRR